MFVKLLKEFIIWVDSLKKKIKGTCLKKEETQKRETDSQQLIVLCSPTEVLFTPSLAGCGTLTTLCDRYD